LHPSQSIGCGATFCSPSRLWTGRRDLLARIIVGKGSIADSPLLLLDRILPPFEGNLPTGDFEIGEFSPLLECLGESLVFDSVLSSLVWWRPW